MADFTTLMLLGYLLMVLVVSRTHLMRKKRVHRLWVRKIFRERERLGFYNTLLSQLRLSDTEYFFRFIRMTPRRFDDLLSIVGPYIQRKSCRSRRVISAGERLAVCLRYLATGDSQQTQSFSFRIGRSTVCKIIHETCDAIWSALRSKYLKAPASLEDWKNIAKGFNDEWNFPTCVGAIDGKHVCIECPKNAGSAYYNYKNFHSMVLLAVCDSNYTFTMVDIGSYGRDNDASIFAESSISTLFQGDIIQLPEPCMVNQNAATLPYTLVGDDIFPLKTWLMKPYPGKSLTLHKRIYNYRLSRARRTIENTFGILAAKWRIFRRPIRASPENVERIIKACVCLHNYLRLTDNASYTPSGFVDKEGENGEIIPGDWRNTLASSGSTGLQSLSNVSGNRYCFDAVQTRDNFAIYFNSVDGQVPWQVNHVTQDSRTL